MPLDMKNLSARGRPSLLSSRNNQCRNKNKRKTPPATRRIGADFPIDSATTGSLDHAAERTCIGVSEVLKAQTMRNGSSPRTKNTEKNIPQVKNHLLALAPMPESTSALMMALSTEEIASKSERPSIVIMAPNNISIFY